MNFKLILHKTLCLLKKNNHCCPFREFYYTDRPACEYFNKVLEKEDSPEYDHGPNWKRCDKCIIEEQKQKRSNIKWVRSW